ncbi:hypothetical protein AN7083.2 [Aspergillus nidulans FGSC A4]|uniref:DltD N-terminal domain protein (AFU_orthologue AFUA_8G00380) n=1 Tax=Emericella nidulans (strain FGSC A4 / ATCC 38163 / CBS 112.46 / NRRL 194 / M139) TaxID=227321 RepID=Q5AX97_EMENI|nr:hypothetical protein [Aspergillus nidulans FGSC A4]EAA61212.1 hypothetical protein AN7083.2 [Aspergillus nidulans FGSC A4]CBF79117.1 TPA: DltD N-terminal domain protein (AFU_orthologue; AFUA_8G00380) [Aspergillus nidulans FGSC A4]|eukprot:XP_664687.1 hypothetical protein AN7083.2 [Aspergillus nidulans FGSC A4]
MLGLPDVALHFQTAGVTVLLYDPRSTGLSDGTPRNEIDPVKQAADYSDALTFLSTQASVYPSQLFFWGMSFSAVVALCAATTDKRIRGVLAIAPLTDLTYKPEHRRAKVLQQCMQDRASQSAGNEPYYLPLLNEQGENPAGFGVGLEREEYARIVAAGRKLAKGHVNRTTIQSYYHMAMWQPFGLWAGVAPTPVMFVVPEMDTVSPAERQREYFDTKLGNAPRRLHLVEGAGHMDIVQGAHLEGLMEVKMRFVQDILEGRVEVSGDETR